MGLIFLMLVTESRASCRQVQVLALSINPGSCLFFGGGEVLPFFPHLVLEIEPKA